MKALVGFAVIAFVGGCGPADAPAQRTDSTIAEFETAREDAARLITGSAADWNAASDQARTAYSITSAIALLGGGGSAEERAALGRAFRRCMDAQVARAAPSASLGDLSYECVLMARSG